MTPDPNGHKTRFSDSSFYDEVCVNCGATDAAGDDRLNHLCPNPNGDEPFKGPIAVNIMQFEGKKT